MNIKNKIPNKLIIWYFYFLKFHSLNSLIHILLEYSAIHCKTKAILSSLGTSDNDDRHLILKLSVLLSTKCNIKIALLYKYLHFDISKFLKT